MKSNLNKMLLTKEFTSGKTKGYGYEYIKCL